MDHEENRHQQQAADAQSDGEALEATEIAGAGRRHDRQRRRSDAQRLRQAEVVERQS